MKRHRFLNLFVLAALLAGLLPLAAAAQPRGDATPLAGLFEAGRPYDPAVARAAIASAGWALSAEVEDETNWTQRFPANRPPARVDHAMAYDSARGVTVLFGGEDEDWNRLADTWEWDGAVWTQRFPAHAPPARTQHAMAYDSARGVTVLFGGYLQEQDDTWEWDGTDWTQRFPAHKPPTRWDQTMAYDSARGVTVLFGGEGQDYNLLDDTWEWDGTDWTERFPAHKPPARHWHDLAYDGARGVTVLFGGIPDGYWLDDTWEWDGTDWTERFPSNKPPGLIYHALAYDSGRGVTVLFGGYPIPNDTWEWDGTDWTQRSPANRPSGREYHAMAYDSARGVTVLFGGLADPFVYLDDTWEYGPPSPPLIVVTPDALHSEQCVDAQAEQALHICNQGGADLTWSLGEETDWLSAEPASGTTLPGGCTEVTVAFDSAGLDPGDYFADILVDSNDPVTPQVTVPAQMTVLDCFPGELHILRIKIFRPAGAPWVVKATTQVQIVDQAGAWVPGATVVGEYTLPDGYALPATPFWPLTDSLGRNKFQLREEQFGLYAFCVTGITAPGFAPWPPGGYPGDPGPCIEIVALP